MELSRVGGLNVKDVTRRIMYRVFTNKVGMLYSWEGAKKKKCFKNLAIASVILGISFLLFYAYASYLRKVFVSNKIEYILKDMSHNNYIYF